MFATSTALLLGAGLAAGATVIGSSKAASAAKSAGDQQAKAAEDATAAQERIYQQQRADNEPFRQVGLSAAQALSGAFGLSPPSMTGQTSRTSVVGAQGMGGYASTPVPGVGGVSMTGTSAFSDNRTPGVNDVRGGEPYSVQTSGSSDPYYTAPGVLSDGRTVSTPDWSAYLTAHPDVAAGYQAYLKGTTEGFASPGTEGQSWQDWGYQPGLTAEQFAQRYQDVTGKGVGYEVPMTSAPAGPAPGYTDPTAPNGYTTGPRPDLGPGPAPYAAPARTDFGPLDVSMTKFQASPDYQFRVDQGNRALAAQASSAGRLMSGSRLKAAEQFGQNIAGAEYTDWRNYTTGQYNTDRSRSDNIYESDRGFGYGQARDARGDFTNDRARSDGLYADDRSFTTGRYDTRNNTLLSLAGFGTGANAQNQAAGTTFAQQQGNNLMTAANARANGQIGAANAWTSGLNNLVTTGAYLGGQLMTRPQTPATAFTTPQYSI